MEKQDWNHLGDEIKFLVQNAVNNQDYSKLNENVTEIVHQAMGQIGKGLQDVANRLQTGSIQQERTVSKKEEVPSFVNVQALKIKTGIWSIVGGLLTTIWGIGFLVLLTAFLLYGTSASNIYVVGIVIALVLFGLSLVFLLHNLNKTRCIDRYENYCHFLTGHAYYEISELAKQTGRSVQHVRKDVRRMLALGWFPEGNLDAKETCLMLTKKAYEQYITVQNAYAERKQQEAILTPQVKMILDEGQKYLDQIHTCNEKIIGEEISPKISRMELLVHQILEQVKKQPKAADDLRKMMSYYLPTAVKLLGAYADMDVQAIQGENIACVKKEIENTLDTLNVAFEKLSDEIFRDLAWDVSTDISVLHTMLAQEGLTKSPLS